MDKIDMDYYGIIVKNFTAGVLSAYLLIYGLRPSVMYPDIILELFENKWLFLILLVINYYLFMWDKLSGALLLLCIIALIFDYAVFTDRIQNTPQIVANTKNESFSKIEPTFEPVVQSVDLVTGTFQENMINQLKQNVPKIMNYHGNGAPSPFI
jgi:hypothetical protein